LSEELRAKLTNIGLLVGRVAIGLLMLVGHGYPKLLEFSAKAATFPDPLGIGSGLSLGLAVFAEFFCAILIIIGAATRLAAVPLVITMLVAGLIVHSADPWSTQEKAIVYAVPFLMLVFTGPGKLSVDALVDFMGE
jgi:putative oxidoreductase